MGADQVLVAIQPQELTFTFELKKQSSCSVQLVNKSKDYVAFKVKTTSPKRYCVRPNTGIILPRSTCDFTVTMQAPKEAPPGMQLKDKFLVQSTVVPYGTTDEDIVPSFFSKENGRYIQENKLKVVLVSPPHSPVVKPINGALKQEPPYENPDSAETCISNNGALQHELAKDVPTLRTSISDNGAAKQESIHENPMLKETCSSSDQAVNEVTDIAPDKEVPVLRETSISDNGAVKEGSIHENPMLKETCISSDQALSGAADISPSHVVKDIDDLKLKLTSLEVKLNEAGKTIMLLQRENSAAFHEREKLQQEIALLRSKSAARIRAGFPFLFVVFMALVGMALGYLLHS